MTDGSLLASVVIAVKDDCRARRLLRSLLNQSVPGDRYEVIVVENGSSELADVEGLGDGTVRYLHRSEANTAAARNVGLTAARGRYLLLTDSDCVVDVDWIKAMTTFLCDERVAAVGGGIGKCDPTTWVQRHAITIVNGQAGLSYLPALHLPYVAGANAGFDTAKLREIGGFDESLKSGNDVDVCYKLGLRGYDVGLVNNAMIWHDDRADLCAHFRRFRHYAMYQVLLYAKYRQVSGKRLVLDTYPFRRLASAVAMTPRAVAKLVHGDPDPALRAFLQMVEAAGVLCGDVAGAIRFRQLYL